MPFRNLSWRHAKSKQLKVIKTHQEITPTFSFLLSTEITLPNSSGSKPPVLKSTLLHDVIKLRGKPLLSRDKHSVWQVKERVAGQSKA